MNKYILALLILTTVNVFAQFKNSEPANKVTRITTIPTSELLRLDSLYLTAAHIDTSKCAFPTKQDSVMVCLGRFWENLDRELKKKNFNWKKVI